MFLTVFDDFECLIAPTMVMSVRDNLLGSSRALLFLKVYSLSTKKNNIEKLTAAVSMAAFTSNLLSLSTNYCVFH